MLAHLKGILGSLFQTPVLFGFVAFSAGRFIARVVGGTRSPKLLFHLSHWWEPQKIQAISPLSRHSPQPAQAQLSTERPVVCFTVLPISVYANIQSHPLLCTNNSFLSPLWATSSVKNSLPVALSLVTTHCLRALSSLGYSHVLSGFAPHVSDTALDVGPPQFPPRLRTPNTLHVFSLLPWC